MFHSSQLLNLISDDQWVVLADLCRPQCLVVKAAFVRVRVPMLRTEQTTAATREASQSHLLITSMTSVLLLEAHCHRVTAGGTGRHDGLRAIIALHRLEAAGRADASEHRVVGIEHIGTETGRLRGVCGVRHCHWLAGIHAIRGQGLHTAAAERAGRLSSGGGCAGVVVDARCHHARLGTHCGPGRTESLRVEFALERVLEALGAVALRGRIAVEATAADTHRRLCHVTFHCRRVFADGRRGV
jgi:hypothetical protein